MTMKFMPAKNFIARPNPKRFIAAFVILIIIFAVFLPLNQALAAEPTPPKPAPLIDFIGQVDCGGAGQIPVIGTCLGRMFAWVIFWILAVVTKLFSVFGLLFDAIAQYALSPSNYDFEPLKVGWRMVRDTANLFFIFILLTIAISTILRLENYGVKRLLPKLIVAALFINFSFLITQYIIYSSNILTGLFLPGVFDGKTTDLLSEKFAAGINPNAMFASFDPNLRVGDLQAKLKETRAQLESFGQDPQFTGTDEEKKVLGELEQKRKDLDGLIETAKNNAYNTVTQLIIVMLGVTVFLLIAVFVLAVAAVLLLIRIVVLWFLLVLSPIAFLAHAFPGGMGGIAQQWWSSLLKQAFFAPAFFFLFLISVNMIAQFPQTFATGKAYIDNWQMIMFYSLTVAMMLGSLIIAQKMGAVGAAQTIKYGQAALKYGRGYVGRTGSIYAAPVARKVMEAKEGRVGRILTRIPIIGRAATRATGLDKKAVSDYEKKYRNYSMEALRALQAPGAAALQALNPAQRTAIENVLRAVGRKQRRRDLLDNPNAPENQRLRAAVEEEAEERMAAEERARGAEGEIARDRERPRG